MQRTRGQQMLQWGSVLPTRTVGIDLADADRDAGSVGGRLAEHVDRKEVAEIRGLGRAVDSARQEARTPRETPAPRFHLERLSRELIVDEIIAINPTASVDFLSDFEDDGLRLYLGRLRSSQLGRGRASMADRPAGPAVTCAPVRKF